ncbi:MAG: ribosome-associated translation inhibitor RaiA [Patescibacteria group bacterium]
MKINIKATNIELTDALSSYVNEKIRSTEKFMVPHENEDIFVQAELGKLTNHHRSGDMYRAEVNLTVRGKYFRAESEKGDLYAAIDDLRDELVRELNSNKKKDRVLLRKGAAMIKNILRFGREK